MPGNSSRSTRTTRGRFGEWQLTPSNSPLVRGLLYASWLLAVGFATFLGAVAVVTVTAAAAVDVGLSPPSWLLALAGLLAAVAGVWRTLAWLRSSRRGRSFLRVRLPEPTDPTRSVVEYASLETLTALAGVGALGYVGVIVAANRVGVSAGIVLAVALVAYAFVVVLRWWLPTAGSLAADGTLRLTSIPREPSGRTWHGALETTYVGSVADLERARRLVVGREAVVVLDTGRIPLVAIVPVDVFASR